MLSLDNVKFLYPANHPAESEPLRAVRGLPQGSTRKTDGVVAAGFLFNQGLLRAERKNRKTAARDPVLASEFGTL